MKDFREICLSGAPVFLDGAMGTYIQQMGGDLFGAKNNLDRPDLVRKVHDDYIAAGSQMITTNTFSLNEIYMAKKAFELDAMGTSLHRAMEIACDAAVAAQSSAGKIHVLGGFGPCGELFMRGRCKNYENEQVVESYVAQAETMCQYPISAFLLETFFDLTESGLVVEACKRVNPNLPIIMSLTFATTNKGGATLMGNRSAQIAEWANDNDIFAVGANCGDLTPSQYAEIIKEYKGATTKPLFIEPNAGMPVLDQNGEAQYPMKAQEFADQMVECYRAGARILGGCCGTDPSHIKALIKAISKEI
jgi:5-methyltetrahydrofolate--homocysteine methyltransferase